MDESLPCASYSRFSSALQKEESITDQQRCCRDAAAREGLAIAPDLEFADAAVSGTKLERDGLTAMLRAAKEGRFRCLLFYSLSRLARESVISMPMLKELVYVHRVRIISVTEGIDSDREGWEMSAGIFSIMAERYIKDLGVSVFRGQEGTLAAGYAVGDHCFGYSSVPVPGSENMRNGRNAKPRMMYVIDDKTAHWVIQIFTWFVGERRSILWITKQLNSQGAPKDHRATTNLWRHQYVSKLLANPKYVGIWPWGQRQNNRNPLNGAVHQETRSAEETKKWTRELPHLQIIDRETWNAAQTLLEENKERHTNRHAPNGRWTGSRRGNSADNPRHLLSGLILCEACGAFLAAGGTNGEYLRCPSYLTGQCDCKTQLKRELAEKMILEVVGNLILSNESWKNAVFKETSAAWKQQSQQRPEKLGRVENALADVNRKIQHLMDSIESGNDSPEVRERVQDRRREKDSITKQLQELRQTPEMLPRDPTPDWLDDQLRRLSEIIRGENPVAAFALRKIVGGAIPVSEVREPDRKRFYFRGKIRVSVPQVMQAFGVSASPISATAQQSESGDTPAPATGVAQAGDGSELLVNEVVIDFREPSIKAAQADRAKKLFDEGLLNAQVAAQMGCARSRVTDLLRYWHELRGLNMVDGRKRMSSLMRRPTETADFDALSRDARKLWDEGLADVQIAVRLACSLPTTIAAVDHSFQSTGEPLPDHDARQILLQDRLVAQYEKDLPLSEIAGQVGLCPQIMTRLLQGRLQQLGRTGVDGRSRPRKSQS